MSQRAAEIASALRRLGDTRRVCKARVKDLSQRVATAQQFAQDCVAARQFLQGVAQEVQRDAHKRISEMVTFCLAAVFPNPYEFRIIFEQKRGKTEAQLVFTRNGMDVDPLTASGGGAVDVASFALRLSCIMLSNPPLRRLLCLDEPFKFVSEEHRPAVRDMLLALTKDLGFQVVMVTHLAELECGTVIRLESGKK